MCHLLRFIFLLTFLDWSGVAHGLQAVDDELFVVAGERLPIAPLLLANDLGSGQVTPVGEPLSNALIFDQDEEQWFYCITEEQLAGKIAGVDTFEYEIVTAEEISKKATVTIRAVPRWIPLAGGWWPSRATAPGDNLGWYDTLEATFKLCELNMDDELLEDDCPVLVAPHQVVAGLPLVGDWNGDGLDGVGIYDRSLREFHLYEVPPGMTELVHYTSIAWGETSLIPTAGDWNADLLSSPALYDPWNLLLWRLAEVGEQAHPTPQSLGYPAWNAIPLTGDWPATGPMTVALYDLFNHTTHFVEDPTSPLSSHPFRIEGQVPSPGSWPLAFHWQNKPSTIAVYDPLREAFFLLYDDENGPRNGSTRLVKIPCDPGGRPTLSH